MPELEEFSVNQWIIVAFLFAISFGLLIALNAANQAVRDLPFIGLILNIPSALNSPMFTALPIVAFFFLFFIVDWINKYFETTQALHPLFVVLFFGVALFAFYVALFWYMSNFKALGDENALNFDFWARLQGNAFMLFIWGGTLGWITRFAVEKLKL